MDGSTDVDYDGHHAQGGWGSGKGERVSLESQTIPLAEAYGCLQTIIAYEYYIHGPEEHLNSNAGASCY